MYTQKNYNEDKQFEEEMILRYQRGGVELIRSWLRKSPQAKELAEVLEKGKE